MVHLVVQFPSKINNIKVAYKIKSFDELPDEKGFIAIVINYYIKSIFNLEKQKKKEGHRLHIII
jgi:hypothetical protein